MADYASSMKLADELFRVWKNPGRRIRTNEQTIRFIRHCRGYLETSRQNR